MQKIYFDNTMFFRENGKAHNKVEAFGYCVSFKDTYCKSMKIEKIVISTNPSIPAYSGERHNKNTGKRIHTANIINTYFFTILFQNFPRKKKPHFLQLFFLLL